MSIDLSGHAVLVTGAARGIGRATCLALAEAGAAVVATDVSDQVDTVPFDTASVEDLSTTGAQVRAAGGQCVTAAADVRDIDQLRAAVNAGTDRFGRLYGVVANAGIASFGPSTWQLSEAQWSAMIDINLTGAWNTVRACVPAILQHGAGGSIVLVSSSAAVKPLPTIGHYAAAKAGVIAMMKSLALELAGEYVRVNAIAPGGTATPMTTNPKSEEWQASVPGLDASLELPIPIRRMEPVDIAHGIRWLLSDEARYVTGQTLVIDAGATVK